MGDVRKVDFPPNSFDAVLCLDLIEHLEKKEGRELIDKMEKWARKKVIIYTPNGFVLHEDLKRNPLQEHKSGWTTEELGSLDFKVYGMFGWKALREKSVKTKYRPTLLWELISALTQKITRRYPKHSYALLAIKETNES